MTLRRSAPRAKPRWMLLLATVVLGTLFVVSSVLAGEVSNDAGFQGDDGNLTDDGDGIDWNTFSPVAYDIGTAPYRTAKKTTSGWEFTGIEDAQASTTDTAFAGGVKQDNNCAALTGGKAPNKSDLRRAYFATSRVDGDVFLALAWIRIPQNTTSPSSHVGFEFNQGEDSCGTGHPLVHRTAGDLLVVYDFLGGSADLPKITLREWVTSGSCEVGNQTAPCWGIAVDLTESGDAEGRVNTFGSVIDQVGPTSPQTLGTNEFGEAIINLTDALETVGGNPCRTFGNAYAVSRSSGNSGTAQMKDLVGPGNVDITTCGGIVIEKVTSPSDTADPKAEFDFDIAPNPNGGSFSLTDGDSESFDDVQNGVYTVTEDNPGPLYALTDITCEVDGDQSGWELVDEEDLLAGVEIDLQGSDETVTCTFTNALQSAGTTTTTQPSIIATLHDSATVSGDNNPTGNVTFKLFDNQQCDGDPVFSETVALDNGEAATTDGYDVTTEGTWYWTVDYEGDLLNDPSSSDCLEEIVSIDLTPDPPSDD